VALRVDHVVAAPAAEHVAAGEALDQVVAAAAEDAVIAALAEEAVRLGAAGEEVGVPGAAQVLDPEQVVALAARAVVGEPVEPDAHRLGAAVLGGVLARPAVEAVVAVGLVEALGPAVVAGTGRDLIGPLPRADDLGLDSAEDRVAGVAGRNADEEERRGERDRGRVERVRQVSERDLERCGVLALARADGRNPGGSAPAAAGPGGNRRTGVDEGQRLVVSRDREIVRLARIRLVVDPIGDHVRVEADGGRLSARRHEERNQRGPDDEFGCPCHACLHP
jgi:hypothetical protein